MRITLCDPSEGDVVGREDASRGEFFRRGDGTIWYRNALDPQEWFVGANHTAFAQAAAALNEYSAAISGAADEMAVVRKLEADLNTMGRLSGESSPFWQAIADQARDGML